MYVFNSVLLCVPKRRDKTTQRRSHSVVNRRHAQLVSCRLCVQLATRCDSFGQPCQNLGRGEEHRQQQDKWCGGGTFGVTNITRAIILACTHKCVLLAQNTHTEKERAKVKDRKVQVCIQSLRYVPATNKKSRVDAAGWVAGQAQHQRQPVCIP